LTSTPQQEARGRDDVRSIVAWLDEKPTLSRYVGAARRLDELHDARPELFGSRNVLVVRNFTIEPIEPLLKVAAYQAGIRLHLGYSGYDPAAAEEDNDLDGRDPDVVLLFLRLEELAPALTRDFLATTPSVAAELAEGAVDHVVSLARRIRNRSRATILVHNFVAPVSPAAGLGDSQQPGGQLNMVRRMNLDLVERVQQVDGAHILDVDHVFAELGLRRCYDDRGDRMSDAPLSQLALRALAYAQARHIRAIGGPIAKCVIVDCDNTLWGGVIGEDGMAGVALGETGAGRKHRDLQQSLLDLRRRGVVLAICSKNEEDDVLDVLRRHPNCVVHEDDFAAMRINWDDKAANIESIVAELNLGLEQVVFVDDNPVECEWVRTRLPSVRVVEWPGDVGDGANLDDLGLFDSLVVTDEDRTRTDMYKAEVKRRAARDEVASVDDYLRSLAMVATVGRAKPEHLPRLAQLTQRTNQFNLTTRRYDVSALEQIIEDPAATMVWLDLSDRFGSNGMVGCGIVRRKQDAAVIDTLLLSCRVLGRGVERVIVNRLATLAGDMGATNLIGEYIPSDRNMQVADLYGRLGFDGPEIGGQATVWRWDLAAGPPTVPDWFEIVDRDGGAA
jgi:FkbH-like protein